MLHNEQAQEYIHWAHTLETFIITDVDAFSANVLPQYFRHGNFTSFIRQLNIYGFKKLNKRSEDNLHEFHHPFFQRGRPDLLIHIKRKLEAKEIAAKMRKSRMDASSSTNSDASDSIGTEIAASSEEQPPSSAELDTRLCDLKSRIVFLEAAQDKILKKLINSFNKSRSV